jgi:hypothetical protein
MLLTILYTDLPNCQENIIPIPSKWMVINRLNPNGLDCNQCIKTTFLTYNHGWNCLRWIGFFIFSRKPLLQGLGFTLAVVKPQISILAILFLLLFEQRYGIWKVLLIPTLTLVAILFLFGVN